MYDEVVMYIVQTELRLTVCGLYSGHFTYRVSALSYHLEILYLDYILLSSLLCPCWYIC